jgi:hypothetical protein
MSKKSTESNTRKRYTPEEKANVLDYISTHNAQNGRGGQSAASKHFGIPPITLAAWSRAADSPAPVAKKRGRKPGSTNVATASGTGYASKLSQLSSLAQEIDKAESELEKLKSKFSSLVSKL